MQIKTVNTEYFKEEMATNGHHPMFFMCDDR